MKFWCTFFLLVTKLMAVTKSLSEESMGSLIQDSVCVRTFKSRYVIGPAWILSNLLIQKNKGIKGWYKVR